MLEDQDYQPIISIGDLVCLKGDKDLKNGIGLVLDKRDDTAEIIKDFIGQLGIKEDDEEVCEAMQAANDYLLNTSVYLVFWNGGSTKSVFRNIWMFYNEIELLSKVSSSKDENKGETK